MGRKISKTDWDAYDGEFFWIEHNSLIIDHKKEHNEMLKKIIIKWCMKNLENWFYYEENYWIFATKKDAILVKSVVMSGYFDNQYGEV
jgi:hypothetical protein